MVRSHPSKHVGILNNPLYRGQLIWGCRDWHNSRNSQRPEWREWLRLEEDWMRIALPDLKIVKKAVADNVREEVATRVLPPGSHNVVSACMQRSLLSGLIMCAYAGRTRW